VEIVDIENEDPTGELRAFYSGRSQCYRWEIGMHAGAEIGSQLNGYVPQYPKLGLDRLD